MTVAKQVPYKQEDHIVYCLQAETFLRGKNVLSVMMPGQVQTWMIPGTRAHMSRKDMLTNK